MAAYINKDTGHGVSAVISVVNYDDYVFLLKNSDLHLHNFDEQALNVSILGDSLSRWSLKQG